MPRTATVVPSQDDFICEGCGYLLNGLPEGNPCPECGKPSAESAGHHREAPAWETATGGGRIEAFFATSAAVIFHPTYFYRHLASGQRTPRPASDAAAARSFARIHWTISSILLGICAASHLIWIMAVPYPAVMFWVLIPALGLGVYVFLAGVTLIAARLSSWEAAYRGLRLPHAVVLRALHYHAAHYLPVSLSAAFTILYLRSVISTPQAGVGGMTAFLIVLSLQIVLCAVYLFGTYWIGMRNVMYANK